MKLSCLLAFIALLSPLAKADEWDKRTVVTFNVPVEVPGVQNHGHGVVLTPGTYVIKLADSTTDRDVVQIFNKNESRIYTTTIAIPEYRLAPTSHTVIDFEERPKGSPEAMKDWYYPGDLRGEEFLYTKPLLMAATQQTPVATKHLIAEAKPAPAPAPAPVEQPQPAPAPAPQAPVQVAQATPAPQPASVHSQPMKQLPKTASDLSLVALCGLFSVAAGLVMRKSNA